MMNDDPLADEHLGRAHPEPAKPSAPPGGGRGGEAPQQPAASEPPPGCGALVLAPAPNVRVRVHTSGGLRDAPVATGGRVSASVPHSAQPQHVTPRQQLDAAAGPARVVPSPTGMTYPGAVSRDAVAQLRNDCRAALRDAGDDVRDWVEDWLLPSLSALLGERQPK